MKLFRYNAQKRTDRRFNTTGKEKNPNRVKFFARSLDYAKKYEAIYNKDGDVLYKCELEIVEFADDAKLFDMVKLYHTTRAYKVYVSKSVNQQLTDYSRFLLEAKTKKDKKFWQAQIDNLKKREQELVAGLFSNEFQMLSDYELQNVLVAELKEEGFTGYFTNNEVAIF